MGRLGKREVKRLRFAQRDTKLFISNNRQIFALIGSYLNPTQYFFHLTLRPRLSHCTFYIEEAVPSHLLVYKNITIAEGAR